MNISQALRIEQWVKPAKFWPLGRFCVHAWHIWGWPTSVCTVFLYPPPLYPWQCLTSWLECPSCIFGAVCPASILQIPLSISFSSEKYSSMQRFQGRIQLRPAPWDHTKLPSTIIELTWHEVWSKGEQGSHLPTALLLLSPCHCHIREGVTPVRTARSRQRVADSDGFRSQWEGTTWDHWTVL